MTEQTPNSKKGKPTPARKQQEAARKRPLIAPKTKEAQKAAREAMKQERLAARAGYAAGDDKYLTKRDAGPQRRLMRDVVDARLFTVGELLLPLMLISVLFGPGTSVGSAISGLLSNLVLVLFVFYLVDTVLIARKAKALLTKRFGAGKVEKGIWLYVAFRAMYPRVIRLPKAQVSRGAKL
ncbi:MAG: DUF3043 domain-containing protein [Micrococcales bacterium]